MNYYYSNQQWKVTMILNHYTFHSLKNPRIELIMHKRKSYQPYINPKNQMALFKKMLQFNIQSTLISDIYLNESLNLNVTVDHVVIFI